MKNYIPVSGNSNLVKDPRSNAVININNDEIRAAKERKKRMQEKAKEEQLLKQDVQDLKEDMSEIKSLLQQLLEKK